MATVALGLGTSHSPMLSTSPELWSARLAGDRELYAAQWDELVATRGSRLATDLEPACWTARHASVQRAIDELAATLQAAAVDLVVIVGDDQGEVFPAGTLPPFAVWCADTAEDDPPDHETLPPFRVASLWAFYGDGPTTYPCCPGLARHIVERVSADGFDITTVSSPPPGRHLGHAFTFVQRRLVREPVLPMVPVLLNTFFPRSQPSVRRCDALGTALVRAIEAWPGHERVAIVASGGLSHQLVDEPFDRALLTALASPSPDGVLAFSNEPFTDGDRPCGTGESKNWIVVAAAARAAGLTMDVVAYEPLYRTPAGTGIGAAFARWKAIDDPAAKS